jgi:serine/threonine protein kinase
MLCALCGKEAPEGAKFCLQCGAAITDPGAATQMIDEDESVLQLRTVQNALSSEFEVEREIGRGSMAIVYKAVETALNRRVALKVLPPTAPVRRSIAERFKREARLAASLDHANIIPVYRVGQIGATHFIAMKYIDGLGLDEIIAIQGPLPIPVVLLVLRAATAALAYAHEKGIVHRDVKGGNILLDRDGRVLVSDFGIARAMEDASMTATGAVIGTPYFMSPEQCAARKIGPQSDQYSIGVVAFQMLCGDVPFNAETLPGIMHHHFYTPVPDLRRARDDIPPELLAVVNRSLSKKPDRRFMSTDEMLAAVDAIPFSLEDRRIGEDKVRELARGSSIERIEANPLPPLIDPSSRMTPPAGMSLVSPRRVSPSRRAIAFGVFLGVSVLGSLAWSARVTRTEAAREQVADSVTRTELAARRSSARGVVAELARREKSQPNKTSRRLGGAVSRTEGEAAPAEPGVVRMGLVRVRAYPVDADISFDGRDLGRGVVLDAEVPAGPRRLRVRAAGYVDFDSTVTIVAGETTQLPRIDLLPRVVTP